MAEGRRSESVGRFGLVLGFGCERGGTGGEPQNGLCLIVRARPSECVPGCVQLKGRRK